MHTASLRIKRPPYRLEAVLPDGVFAILVFIATEVMFFAGLMSAFLVVKTGAVWPPPGQPRLPIEATAFNTLVLLMSGLMLMRVERAFAELRDIEQTKRLLGLSISLGAFFVVLQGYEWVRLLNFGLTMRSSSYGAFFYLIVGAHAVHAVAALVTLGYCFFRLDQGEMTRAMFTTVQIFWYFVVLLWPVLYVLVYLA